MAVRSGTIPNFINGVSQQAASLRLPSQAETQINCFPTLIDGLKKRPSLRHIASLMGVAPASTVFSHTINRDSAERYAVIIADGDLKVFDLATGAAKTVAFPDGKTYLASADPKTSFRAVTIADYSFIVNKDVTATMKAASNSPTRLNEAIINIKQGNYGKTYRVLINGASAASVTTPDGSQASMSPQLDTTSIAATLAANLNTAGFNTAPWGVAVVDNVVYLVNNTANFTISMQDGFNGNAASVAKGTIQRFSDLPLKGIAGFVTEIVGDDASKFDNYYVTFDGTVWKETVKPNTPWEIDGATMPHILVRETNGTFTFKRAAWDKRLVGDTESAPNPSFIGRKISDVFFFRNRFGVLADENVIMSRSGSFFNFFRGTAVAVLDGDPIDVAASHIKVSILRHAVPLGENLALFSDQTEFSLHTPLQSPLTPKTVAITPTTELPSTRYARPVATGDLIYFLADSASSIRAYEYKVDPDTQKLNGDELTNHVPSYLPPGVSLSAVSSKHNFFVVNSASSPDSIFCYQWYTAGRDKLQSAWHTWTLGSGAQVLGMAFVDSDLYVTVKRDGSVWLEVISVDPKLNDSGLTHWLCLDRRVHSYALAAPTYDSVNNRTSYVLPYNATGVKAVIAATSGTSYAGMPLDVDSVSTTTIRLKGNTTALQVYFGLSFQAYYELSPILPKKQTQTGSLVISNARLQLRHLSLVYGDNTADWIAQVTPTARTAFEYVVGGYALGSMQTDKPPLGKGGVFRIPVNTRSDLCKIVLKSDSHLPGSLISADWEGQLFIRAAPGGPA